MKTIRSSTEISALFSCGKRIHTPYLTFIIYRNTQLDRGRRVAFIAGKKLGGAVWRNSAKRRMREICRNLGGPWEEYDIIFLAKQHITTAPFDQVIHFCAKGLSQEGIIQQQNSSGAKNL